jgi:hypothetical protein
MHMQCLFQVAAGDQQDADRVLEACLKKRVRNMMYQVRVDAVKKYYNKMKHRDIKDPVACHIDLEYEQYKEGKFEWLNDEVWLLLCDYWCSDEYKENVGEGKHFAQVMKIFLKTEEDLDHSHKHNKYWYACVHISCLFRSLLAYCIFMSYYFMSF